MTAASMGYAAQFGADSVSPVTKQFEFISCDIGKHGSLVESPGMRGTRSHIQDAVNAGTYSVGGNLVMEPRPDDLAVWLPRILGAAAVGTTFALAETLPDCYCTIDKVAKVFTYDGVKVNRAVFESAAGQNLRLSMDLEGKTETAGAAGTFPAISASLSTLQPYVHQEAVLTVGVTTYALRNVRVTIDNALILDRFMNSLTRVSLPEGDRVITLECENPFTGDEIALYDLAVTGLAGSLVYTNATVSLTFTFANLKVPTPPIAVAGRAQEIPMRLAFKAFQSGANKELVVTNDSTP